MYMSKSLKGKNNPNWKGGISKTKFICEVCGKAFYRHHSLKAHFCSRKCKAEFQKTIRREKHPRWQGGIREKICQCCGKRIIWKSSKPYSTFIKQKFCSKKCSDKCGVRYKGKDNPNWKGGRQIRDMNKQLKWSRKVFKRDNYTCQDCGQRGGDLQAHHIKGFTDYPELRWKLSNGRTLCKKCHYKTYTFHGNQSTGSIENGVNSGKLLTGNAEDNPEPSPKGKVRRSELK